MSPNALIPSEVIESKIYLIRGQKVMLDSDLAVLYGVETKVLNQQVKRNILRFPQDFMFQLGLDEEKLLRSQIVTLEAGRGKYKKYPSLVFTEQGIAMLSSVLRSERAICVNIAIMRAFVQLRKLLSTYADLAKKIDDLETKYDHKFKVVFDVIKKMLEEDEKPKREIGFRLKV